MRMFAVHVVVLETFSGGLRLYLAVWGPTLSGLYLAAWQLYLEAVTPCATEVLLTVFAERCDAKFLHDRGSYGCTFGCNLASQHSLNPTKCIGDHAHWTGRYLFTLQWFPLRLSGSQCDAATFGHTVTTQVDIRG